MKLRESLRRPDWLKELQAVLVVSLVVAGGLGVIGAVTVVASGSLPAEVPASSVSATLDLQLREGVTVAQEQFLAVTVTDPTLEQWIAWALQHAPTYAVIIAVLALLLRIVWYARRADPFTLATVRRLRVLAVVALAGGWLGFIVETIASMHLSSTVLADGVGSALDVPLYWFLVGFGLFAVAEVVRRGCAMRAELETVI